MLPLLNRLLYCVAGTIFLACLAMWAWQFRRWFRGEPLLPQEPRRPVPWNVVDLLLIGLTAAVVVTVSQWWCIRQFDLPPGHWDLSDLNPAQQVTLITVFSGSSLFIGLVAMMICRWRAKATAVDLGWQLNRWGHDLAVGGAAFVMLIVPVLFLHFILGRVLPSDQSHPFVDLIDADPRLEYLLPIAAAALLAAPLVEEFFFRVLLQGWLERLFAAYEGAVEPPDEPPGPPPEGSTDPPPWPPPLSDSPAEPGVTESRESCAGGSPQNAPPAWRQPPGTWTGERALPEQAALRWAPIFISALAFSLAHFGQGPAPVSLFLLALGLGYLYQRTHRLLPSLVVHFLVNLTAVAQLALAIAGMQA